MTTKTGAHDYQIQYMSAKGFSYLVNLMHVVRASLTPSVFEISFIFLVEKYFLVSCELVK